MHWSDWVIIGWLCFGTLATIATIGQPRKPLEPGVAVLSAIITTAMVVMILLTH